MSGSSYPVDGAARPPGPWRRGGSQHIPRPEHHRLGRTEPWPRRPIDAGAIARAVAAHRAADVAPASSQSRPSAVLVVVDDGPGGAEVLLTKRSAAMRHHSGEVSFPGGRVDPGESFEQTARREAWEEVGLPATAVRVVGQLDPLNTLVSASFIVPVVGRLVGERSPLRPQTTEVDSVFWVPFAELTRADTYREERWGVAELPLHFFELDDETVWGATARILTQLLHLALG